MQTLTTGDLVLDPLTVAHAVAMFDLLSDPALYRYLDFGPPPSLEHLRRVYSALERRESPDGDERWLNWVVRLPAGESIGFVQATLVSDRTAWIAYLLASDRWGRGLASRASAAMLDHLVAAYGIEEFLATVEAANARSIALLGRLLFRQATDGEAAPHSLTKTELLFIRSHTASSSPPGPTPIGAC